jgi:hypothetical protein
LIWLPSSYYYRTYMPCGCAFGGKRTKEMNFKPHLGRGPLPPLDGSETARATILSRDGYQPYQDHGSASRSLGDDYVEHDLNHEWARSDPHEVKRLMQKQLLSPGSRRGWRPREYSAGFLLTFAVFCFVLALLLAGLYAFSSTHQGLA